MSKAKIIKRLNWLYSTERFFAILFTGVIIFVLIRFPPPKTIFLLYGLLIITVILFQGQHYWKLKLYRLTEKPVDQKKNLKLFRNAKRLNLIMIGTIPLILLVQLFFTGSTIKSKNLFLWAAIANMFGILEHINYFHRQLTIDKISDLNYLLKNKRLKIASLKKDIDDNEI